VLAECPAAQDPVRGEIADTDWKGRLAAAAAARAGGRRPAFVAAAEGWRPCATGRRRRWWAARDALGGRVLGSGAAFDRGAAEQAAARTALAALEAEGGAGGAAGGAGGSGADSDRAPPSFFLGFTDSRVQQWNGRVSWQSCTEKVRGFWAVVSGSWQWSSWTGSGLSPRPNILAARPCARSDRAPPAALCISQT
jgi:hypothetical protein